jgi:hypothetical protein
MRSLTAASHDAPAADSPNALDAETGAFTLIEQGAHEHEAKEHDLPLVR